MFDVIPSPGVQKQRPSQRGDPAITCKPSRRAHVRQVGPVPGVVHIGAGNFHRAHQAVYFDDLARSGISNRWGVTGVSLHSPDVKDLLSAQDGLYTVVQRGHDRQTARVVGSIGAVHYALTMAPRSAPPWPIPKPVLSA